METQIKNPKGWMEIELDREVVKIRAKQSTPQKDLQYRSLGLEKIGRSGIIGYWWIGQGIDTSVD